MSVNLGFILLFFSGLGAVIYASYIYKPPMLLSMVCCGFFGYQSARLLPMVTVRRG